MHSVIFKAQLLVIVPRVLLYITPLSRDRRVRLLVGIVVLSAPLCTAEPLRVAVASNFQGAFAAVEAGYSGEVVATYGSSGLLYAQIVQGRPFDVFLSADQARPRTLIAAGKARGLVVYARGRLVLWANHGVPGPSWLTADKRVAIANPETAPYGRAAVEALAELAAAPQRITALNVAQAFHFARSGAADGAFVALAQILAQEISADRYWIVPEELYAPIEQAAVVVRSGAEAAAQAFLARLASDEMQQLIRQAGYR